MRVGDFYPTAQDAEAPIAPTTAPTSVELEVFAGQAVGTTGGIVLFFPFASPVDTEYLASVLRHMRVVKEGA